MSAPKAVKCSMKIKGISMKKKLKPRFKKAAKRCPSCGQIVPKAHSVKLCRIWETMDF